MHFIAGGSILLSKVTWASIDWYAEIQRWCARPGDCKDLSHARSRQAWHAPYTSYFIHDGWNETGVEPYSSSYASNNNGIALLQQQIVPLSFQIRHMAKANAKQVVLANQRVSDKLVVLSNSPNQLIRDFSFSRLLVRSSKSLWNACLPATEEESVTGTAWKNRPTLCFFADRTTERFVLQSIPS